MTKRTLAVTALILGLTAVPALAINLSGNGTIVGTTGNDNLTALNGDDTVWGLGGADNINAGFGNDTIDAGGACTPGVTAGVYPHGLPQSASCEHTPGGTGICGPVNISINGGGQNGGNDTVWGNCGTNNITFSKGEGNDTVWGYGGPNNIVVSNGNDTIHAEVEKAGSNITTGNGNDVVFAINGKVDTINCGSKHTTVHADANDRTSNCTVIHTGRDVKGAAHKSSNRRHHKHTTHQARH